MTVLPGGRGSSSGAKAAAAFNILPVRTRKSSKAGREVEPVQQKAAEARTDAMRQAGRVLSDEQRQAFAKLMGVKLASPGKPAGASPGGGSERR